MDNPQKKAKKGDVPLEERVTSVTVKATNFVVKDGKHVVNNEGIVRNEFKSGLFVPKGAKVQVKSVSVEVPGGESSIIIKDDALFYIWVTPWFEPDSYNPYITYPMYSHPVYDADDPTNAYHRGADSTSSLNIKTARGMYRGQVWTCMPHTVLPSMGEVRQRLKHPHNSLPGFDGLHELDELSAIAYPFGGVTPYTPMQSEVYRYKTMTFNGVVLMAPPKHDISGYERWHSYAKTGINLNDTDDYQYMSSESVKIGSFGSKNGKMLFCTRIDRDGNDIYKEAGSVEVLARKVEVIVPAGSYSPTEFSKVVSEKIASFTTTQDAGPFHARRLHPTEFCMEEMVDYQRVSKLKQDYEDYIKYPEMHSLNVFDGEEGGYEPHAVATLVQKLGNKRGFLDSKDNNSFGFIGIRNTCQGAFPMVEKGGLVYNTKPTTIPEYPPNISVGALEFVDYVSPYGLFSRGTTFHNQDLFADIAPELPAVLWTGWDGGVSDRDGYVDDGTRPSHMEYLRPIFPMPDPSSPVIFGSRIGLQFDSVNTGKLGWSGISRPITVSDMSTPNMESYPKRFIGAGGYDVTHELPNPSQPLNQQPTLTAQCALGVTNLNFYNQLTCADTTQPASTSEGYNSVSYTDQDPSTPVVITEGKAQEGMYGDPISTYTGSMILAISGPESSKDVLLQMGFSDMISDLWIGSEIEYSGHDIDMMKENPFMVNADSTKAYMESVDNVHKLVANNKVCIVSTERLFKVFETIPKVNLSGLYPNTEDSDPVFGDAVIYNSTGSTTFPEDPLTNVGPDGYGALFGRIPPLDLYTNKYMMAWSTKYRQSVCFGAPLDHWNVKDNGNNDKSHTVLLPADSQLYEELTMGHLNGQACECKEMVLATYIGEYKLRATKYNQARLEFATREKVKDLNFVRDFENLPNMSGTAYNKPADYLVGIIEVGGVESYLLQNSLRTCFHKVKTGEFPETYKVVNGFQFFHAPVATPKVHNMTQVSARQVVLEQAATLSANKFGGCIAPKGQKMWVKDSEAKSVRIDSPRGGPVAYREVKIISSPLQIASNHPTKGGSPTYIVSGELKGVMCDSLASTKYVLPDGETVRNVFCTVYPQYQGPSDEIVDASKSGPEITVSRDGHLTGVEFSLSSPYGGRSYILRNNEQSVEIEITYNIGFISEVI